MAIQKLGPEVPAHRALRGGSGVTGDPRAWTTRFCRSTLELVGLPVHGRRRSPAATNELIEEAGHLCCTAVAFVPSVVYVMVVLVGTAEEPCCMAHV